MLRMFMSHCKSPRAQLLADAFAAVLSKENRNRMPLRVRLNVEAGPAPRRTLEVRGGHFSGRPADFSAEEVSSDCLNLFSLQTDSEDSGSDEQTLPDRTPALHSAAEIERRTHHFGRVRHLR